MPDNLLRVGRIALAPPPGMRGGFAEARVYGCALREERWPPLPDGTDDERRAARRSAREAEWDGWWNGLLARSARQEPEALDLDALGGEAREALPVLREQRQFGVPDDDAPVLDPTPGHRWLRAATFFRDPRFSPPAVFGRALLDAGPSWLRIEGSQRTGEDDALLEALGIVAASYRVSASTSDSFALRYGFLPGPPLRPRWVGDMEKAGVRGREMVRAGFVSEWSDGRYAGPLADLSVSTQEEQSAPSKGSPRPFAEALAAASGGLVGTDYADTVLVDQSRQAGGRAGHETVSLYRERGKPVVTASYHWESRGIKADPLRPRILAEAMMEYPAALSDAEIIAAEATARAAWGGVLDSLVSPEQLAAQSR